MARVSVLLLSALLAATTAAAGPKAPIERQDLYFGEALYLWDALCGTREARRIPGDARASLDTP